MAYADHVIESVKDKETKSNKKYLAVKIKDLGWASCWDAKLWRDLKEAAAHSIVVRIDVEESEKTDNQGNPFRNIIALWKEDGGGDPGAGGDGGDEETATAPAPARPAAPPATRPAPGPGPAAPAQAVVGGSDASVRASCALAAAMLAWGGAIAKTPAEVIRWVGAFDEYSRTGKLPKMPEA
jgi:hypothetical protein